MKVALPLPLPSSPTSPVAPSTKVDDRDDGDDDRREGGSRALACSPSAKVTARMTVAGQGRQEVGVGIMGRRWGQWGGRIGGQGPGWRHRHR